METKAFRNRILEYGVKPADQFLAHPKNARLHPQFQRDAMKAALDTVGFVAPVLEAASGYLVDGHERVWAALQNDNAPVPFVKLDISEDEENFVLATFDPLTSLATYDAELLDGLLREVNSDSESIQMMLSNLAAQTGLIPPDNPYDEWVGMPEFEHDDLTGEAAFTIRVFLKDADDLAAFGQLLGKDLTGKKFVWFSKQPIGNLFEVYDETS